MHPQVHSQPEVPAVIQAEVLDLAGYVVSVQGGVDQLAKGVLKCFLVGAGIGELNCQIRIQVISTHTHKNRKVLH